MCLVKISAGQRDAGWGGISPSSAAASRPWGPPQSSLGPGSESSGDQSAARGRRLLSPSPRAHSSTHPSHPEEVLWAFSAPRGHRQHVEAGGWISMFLQRFPGSLELVRELSRLGSTWLQRRCWTDKGKTAAWPDC